jgi:hypothetical protein
MVKTTNIDIARKIVTRILPSIVERIQFRRNGTSFALSVAFEVISADVHLPTHVMRLLTGSGFVRSIIDSTENSSFTASRSLFGLLAYFPTVVAIPLLA